MILTPHAIIGAAIMNMMPNHPALGFCLALSSHYVLDSIPHSDYPISGLINTKAKQVQSILHTARARLHLFFLVSDFICGIVLSFLIFVRDERTLYLTLLGILAGLLPDALQFLYCIWKPRWLALLQSIHDALHTSDRMKDRVLAGYAVQVATVAFFLFLYVGVSYH